MPISILKNSYGPNLPIFAIPEPIIPPVDDLSLNFDELGILQFGEFGLDERVDWLVVGAWAVLYVAAGF